MFDIKDVIPEVFWPANWVWWWAMFAPSILFLSLLWVMGISGTGWLICIWVGIFAVLSLEFAAAFWKVLMRMGMALTVVALITGVSASLMMADDTGQATQTVVRMNQLAFVPFLLTGFLACTAAGILALFRDDT